MMVPLPLGQTASLKTSESATSISSSDQSRHERSSQSVASLMVSEYVTISVLSDNVLVTQGDMVLKSKTNGGPSSTVTSLEQSLSPSIVTCKESAT